jgi:hypothetical protein
MHSFAYFLKSAYFARNFKPISPTAQKTCHDVLERQLGRTTRAVSQA